MVSMTLGSVAAPDTTALDPGDGSGETRHVHYQLMTGRGGSWLPRRVRITETLSGDFSAHVTISPDGLSTLDELLGSSASLIMGRAGKPPQRFSGIVRAIADDGSDGDERFLARLLIEPAFQCLAEETETRCFFGRTRPDVLNEVLSSALGRYGRNFELRLRRLDEKPDSPARYPILDFIQQRAETTRRFAQRLMAEEGMTYFFDHSGSAEKLVVVDENTLFPCLPAPVPIAMATGHVRMADSISGLSIRRTQRPARYTVKGFDATRPRAALSFEARSPNPPSSCSTANADQGQAAIYDPLTPFAIHGYKGSEYTATDMEVQARLRLEAAQGSSRLGAGAADALAFRPGTVFTLDAEADPWRAALAGEYLLVSVTHSGEGDAQGVGSYRNEFTCIPATVPFRPARLQRPRADGIDFAIVTATDDRSIWTDKHGRVRVRFIWDRCERGQSEKDSSWIPVVLNWAGPGYGMQVMPRKGMVVAIAYFGADPDLPMVIGALATADNSHPHELPRLDARLSIVTQSLRDNGQDTEHYNELTMDDTAGAEQLILRAGWDHFLTVVRDSRVEVQRDETHLVGNDQSVTVSGNRIDRVEHDESRTTKGKRTDTVEGQSKVNVSGDRTSEISGKEEVILHADREVRISGCDDHHVKRDAAVTVDGTATLRQGDTIVECADGHLHIDTAKRFRIRHGGAEILVEDGKVSIVTAKSIAFRGESISLDAETITLTASNEASVAAGPSTVKVEQQEVKISAANITETAASIHQTTAGIILQN